MAKPNSRQTLIDYCLRALGAPVVEINVDDDQVEDRVDEALQFYQHYHADAIEKVFLKHQVTSDDITNGYLLFLIWSRMWLAYFHLEKVMAVECLIFNIK